MKRSLVWLIRGAAAATVIFAVALASSLGPDRWRGALAVVAIATALWWAVGALVTRRGLTFAAGVLGAAVSLAGTMLLESLRATPWMLTIDLSTWGNRALLAATGLGALSLVRRRRVGVLLLVATLFVGMWVTTVRARPVPYAQEDTVVVGPAGTLATSVYMPVRRLDRGDGPIPGLVIIGDAGPTTRADVRGFAEWLASHGVAVSIFDERGVGASTGRSAASAGGAIADAGRVVVDLAGRPGVGAVGVLGLGEGAWQAAKVAAQEPATASLVLLSGGGVTVERALKHRIEQRVIAAGFGVEDAGAAAQMRQNVNDFYRGLIDRPTALRRLAVGWDADWWTSVDDLLPGVPDALCNPDTPCARDWLTYVDFSAVEVVESLAIPTLSLHGGTSVNEPGVEAAQNMADVIARVEARNSSAILLPDANHLMVETWDRLAWVGPRFADGALVAIAAHAYGCTNDRQACPEPIRSVDTLGRNSTFGQ